MRDIAYIALGSNLGDREQYLAFARERLGALPDSRIVAESPVEETPPLGSVPQPSFLNQMIALETSLTPLDLLDALLAIEQAAGRVRRERWGSRTLDLDIVSMREQTCHTPRLTVPHPELARRDFWQRQLAQVGVR